MTLDPSDARCSPIAVVSQPFNRSLNRVMVLTCKNRFCGIQAFVTDSVTAVQKNSDPRLPSALPPRAAETSEYARVVYSPIVQGSLNRINRSNSEYRN